jgi:hypothetical protein
MLVCDLERVPEGATSFANGKPAGQRLRRTHVRTDKGAMV